MIYLLKAKKHLVTYDCIGGQVVRASNAKEARKAANVNVGDEGHIWEDPKKVTCVVVKSIGHKAKVILADTHAG